MIVDQEESGHRTSSGTKTLPLMTPIELIFRDQAQSKDFFELYVFPLRPLRPLR
jgi:hypothetical protein